MRKTCHIFLACLVLVFASCKKQKYPESVVIGEPEFFTSLEVDGAVYTYKSGVDSYRVYSSYAKSDTGLHTFISEIKKSDCNGVCPGSIKFEINGSSLSKGQPNMNAELKPGKRDFISPSQQVQFTSSFNKQAQSYFWEFGDGQTSTLANPVHIYGVKGYYKVRLTIISNGGCASTIVNTLKLGYTERPMVVSVLPAVSGKRFVFSTKIVNGTGPYTYLWNFGEDSASAQATPVHTYAIDGSYPVKVKVTDPGKDTVTWNYNVVTDGDISSCAANFSVSVSEGPAGGMSVPLSKVAVAWTDENGQVYKSINIGQSPQSTFEIVSVEDYENNENGKPTKKLKIKFNCILSNGTRSVVVRSQEAVILIAYE